MVPQFACAVLNRYLEATDDFAGLPLARLFTAYRAMVRAKVNCIELDEHLVHASADAARNHLALALQALHNSEPQIIAVGGLSGSGKSTLALALAEKLDAIVIRSDAVRKHLLNCALDQKAPASAYAEDVSQRTYAGMRERAVYALNSGRTVILDAVHAKESRREALQDFAATRGTPFTGLWCEVPHEVACARLIARHGDVSDADIGVLQQQSVRELGHLTWRKVDTSRPVQEIIEMLIDTM